MQYRLILSILFLLFIGHVRAQKYDSATIEKIASFTKLQDAVHIPAAYKVVSFRFVHASKGEIITSQHEGDVIVKWRMNGYLSRAKPGDEIVFDEIKVQKDGRELKWAPKTFIIK